MFTYDVLISIWGNKKEAQIKRTHTKGTHTHTHTQTR